MTLVKKTAIHHSIAVIILLLTVLLVLAACGETSPTTAPTTLDVTSQSGATNIAGQPAASVAIGSATKATPRPNMGIVAPTLQPVVNGTAAIPTVSSTTIIQPDPELLATTAHLVPGVSNPTVQILTSDNAADKLATDTDSSFLSAGYKFVFPGISKPAKLGQTILGLYSKPNSPDVLLSISDVPTDPSLVSQSMGLVNLSQGAAQKFLDQVKGKKSIAILIAATGIMQAFSPGNGVTPPITQNPVTTTTVSGSLVTTLAPAVGEQDIPVYPGSTKVSNGTPGTGDTTTVSYVTSDDYAKVTAWAKQAYTDKGWDGVLTNEQSGLTTLTGRKGKYSLIASILGPKSRENPNFDTYFKQANAGPNDTVMVVVITN